MNYILSKVIKLRLKKRLAEQLPKNDLQAIKIYPLEEGSMLWHSRNIFFLIFNLIGISFTDLVLLTEKVSNKVESSINARKRVQFTVLKLIRKLKGY